MKSLNKILRLPITFLLLIIAPITLSSQTLDPDIQWQKCFGGSYWEEPQNIISTYDEGYIFVGHAKSIDGDVEGNHGDKDYWVVKLDYSGNLIWQKCLGGSFQDEAHSIIQTNDSGFVVAGSTYSNDGDIFENNGLTDLWVVKLNNTGEIIWQKTYGGSGGDALGSVTIDKAHDNGFILFSSSFSIDGDINCNHGGPDFLVIKLDESGNIEWHRCMGGSTNEWASSFTKSTDGGYILAGYTNSNDGDVNSNNGLIDCWVVKIDQIGNIIWQKTIGGTNNDYFTSIIQSNDGSYSLAGSTMSDDGDIDENNGATDYFIVNISDEGVVNWKRIFGGSGNEFANSIIQTTDNGFVIAGSTSSNDGDVSGNNGVINYWIVKLDSIGNFVWQKCLGGSGETANSIIQDLNNDLIIAGQSNSNIFDVSGNHGGGDAWIVKVSNSVGYSDLINQDSQINLFPNPTNNSICVNNLTIGAELNIYNLLNELVYSMEIKESVEYVNTVQFKSGVYILNVSNNGLNQMKKFVVYK